MGRTGLTKTKFNSKIQLLAIQEHRKCMNRGLFKPIQLCRRDAKAKVEKEHFIVENAFLEGASEYDYLVNKAVETGRSIIVYEGRTISIM